MGEAGGSDHVLASSWQGGVPYPLEWILRVRANSSTTSASQPWRIGLMKLRVWVLYRYPWQQSAGETTIPNAPHLLGRHAWARC